MSTFELDGSNNGAAAIDINTTEVFTEDASELGNSRQLARLLLSVGFVTLLMDVATALYKPPRGVVFQGHKLAYYYLTLAGILVAGLAEVSTAYWLSCSGQDHGRRCAFARALLYAAVVPVVIIVALGGSAVIMN